ncbi:efflux RND transporter periplasmic adaptor subunit [Colwellia sp. Arc7-635]|uniref:efflux RND transporter periplasmic adaptor subunit n=1 Tax=Colwellia sp. Arc7-635 TaxID=2497879 RepID=UPI000F857AFE|nr:efflux RND transporter periplasmic adaptor subunit [Colwellia sp. Arc7-635]AZQ84286.1 efflux RND transporter periplasmic adaptor subunit [Colwellia sp. Arc7-635]
MKNYSLKPLTALIVVLTLVLATVILATAPTQALSPQKEKVLSVSVIDVEPQSFVPSYQAFGRTESVQKLSLTSQIEGEVIYVNQAFIAGSQLQKGELIYEIDDRDYLFKLNQKKSELQIAQANLQVELGEQKVAKQEYLRIESEFSDNSLLQKSLMLREPQLVTVKANVTIAQNNVNLAMRDLKRCKVISNGTYTVLAKTIYPGSFVNKGDSIGELVQLSPLRVSLPVPNDVASMLAVGQQVVAIGQNKQKRRAIVSEVSPNLYANSQLRQVYLSIENQDEIFILGEFITVDLQLTPQKNTLRIPLSAIDNGMFWIVDQDKKLSARAATVIWQDERSAIVNNNIAKGDSVVTSAIAGAQEGMLANIVTGIL